VWDTEAATFDDEPHHSLADPLLRSLWWDVLEPVLPRPPARVADLGCGTGSLAVLLAERGHDVVGVDVSPRMLARARAKAAAHGVDVAFVAGDAASPPVAGVDVILTRHVVWALEDVPAALDTWFSLLVPGGRLVLVEGEWHTGAGIAADRLAGLVARPGVSVEVTALDDPALWGAPVVDARYVLVARTRLVPAPRAPAVTSG
jgi:SAM-dependent methyltransferase